MGKGKKMGGVEEGMKGEEEKVKEVKGVKEKEEGEKGGGEGKGSGSEERGGKVVVGGMMVEEMEKNEGRKRKMVGKVERLVRREEEGGVFGVYGVGEESIERE